LGIPATITIQLIKNVFTAISLMWPILLVFACKAPIAHPNNIINTDNAMILLRNAMISSSSEGSATAA